MHRLCVDGNKPLSVDVTVIYGLVDHHNIYQLWDNRGEAIGFSYKRIADVFETDSVALKLNMLVVWDILWYCDISNSYHRLDDSVLINYLRAISNSGNLMTVRCQEWLRFV